MDIPRRRFFYLRHGETDWNAAGRAQGRSDVPLNDLGRTQAREAAAILTGRGIGAIVSSPLVRAHETALLVAETLRLPVALEPDLQEVAFGVCDGEPMGDWYERWLEGEETPRGGESFAALVERGASVLSRHLAEAGEAPMLFVAHGALFRAIRRSLGQTIHVRLPNGAPLECRPDEEAWRIEMLQAGN